MVDVVDVVMPVQKRVPRLRLDDAVAAARFLVDRGDVDPARLAIEGGSAGGRPVTYETLVGT